MDVGDAPTEYRVSTNGKINSYVDSALKALPVRRCLPPCASLRLLRSAHCTTLCSAARASQAPRAWRSGERPSCKQLGTWAVGPFNERKVLRKVLRLSYLRVRPLSLQTNSLKSIACRNEGAFWSVTDNGNLGNAMSNSLEAHYEL